MLTFGRQVLPCAVAMAASARSCVHCLHPSHASTQCPKLFCRFCKGYGHSASVCEKKSPRKATAEADTLQGPSHLPVQTKPQRKPVTDVALLQQETSNLSDAARLANVQGPSSALLPR
jgi:hypothetical protein